MSVQTTYDNAPPVALAGMMFGTGPSYRSSCVAEGAVTAGLIVAQGTSDEQCRAIASGDEPTADPDAILASGIASATTAQNVSGASLNGVVGDDVMDPPRNVTITLGSDADWLASEITVHGFGPGGEPQQETFEVVVGGGATMTGGLLFSQVTSIHIDPEDGTAGTITVGVGTLLGPSQSLLLGLALYTASREPGVYADEEMVPVLREGQAYVTCEGTVAKDAPVYVRVIATGNEVRGAVRGDSDGGDAILMPGAKFGASRTGAGLALVNFDLLAH